MEVSNSKPILNICSAEINPNDLIEVLDHIDSCLPDTGKFQYLMADYWNSIGCFTYFKDLSELRHEDCINGSAFGQLAELRWRKVGNVLRLMLVAEADLHLDNSPVSWKDEGNEVNRWDGKCHPPLSVLLWGTNYANGQWFEARIPRHMAYPVEPKPIKSYSHVKLHFIEYRDKTGRAIIQRRFGISAHIKK